MDESMTKHMVLFTGLPLSEISYRIKMPRNMKNRRNFEGVDVTVPPVCEQGIQDHV